ncbi:hypothetical protein BH09ACT8_BH09ACT8_63160 [soil metagenome]
MPPPPPDGRPGGHVAATPATTSPLFTPPTMAGADLDALTVGPTNLVTALADRVAKVGIGSRPHTLLLGPSGVGKTHTLHVALHRARTDSVADHVLPVIIPEDSLAIGSYTDLLIEAARAIEPDVHREAVILRGQRDDEGIEELLARAAGGRTILLIVENLDRVFRAIGAAGQSSLRRWTENGSGVTVFGSSPALFEGVSSRAMPWYGSFLVERVEELSAADIVTLVGQAARQRGADGLHSAVTSGPGRAAVAEIRGRVGGCPRTWLVLARALDESTLFEVDAAVHLLLDFWVDYYQPRLWNLPAGERRLLTEIARSSHGLTVGEIADAVGISSQSVSTGLRRLAAGRWVSSSKDVTGDRRRTVYDVADPVVREFVKFREQTNAS